MAIRDLVRPLEDSWQGILDAVLRAHTRPPRSTSDVAKLAPRLAELSAAYNEGRAQGARTKLPLEARIAFSFARDVPKGAAAVRELVASGALSRPLRVLDLGAGLGAMTWGLARALGQGAGKIEALLVDEDSEVLRAAETIAREAHAAGQGRQLLIGTKVGDVSRAAELDRGRADVVFLGQVLSEIEPGAEPLARVERQAALLRELLGRVVAPDGALVVVEPALRDRTRHLHRVRDRLLEIEPGASVFAPCLHSQACPALATEGAWCHEDLAVDLPPWLVPLARAAGLRWQGLTFSYLVLRNATRAARLRASEEARGRLRFRAVSELLRSKGKVELWTCSEAGVRARIRRLDREAGPEDGFGLIFRGDVVTLSTEAEGGGAAGPVDERGRVAAAVKVAIDGAEFGG